ncbi:MAG TPA: CdaR family protein [Candidatus Koribacter sp.]|jgi:YbbR domain-containing protein
MIHWLRQHVFGHLRLKLLSLLIATALWYAVAHDQPAEIALSVPIEFYNTPEHLEISSERIQRAEVRVQGPARTLREMTNADIDAVIDLSGTKVGERTFDLTPKQIRHVPHNVQIVQVVPSQIRLELDRSASKTVNLTPRVIGTFATGYRLGDVEVTPNRITITGPESRLTTIDAAITDPVDATGLVGRGTFTTQAFVGDPLVQLMNPEPIHVTVTTVKTKPGEK